MYYKGQKIRLLIAHRGNKWLLDLVFLSCELNCENIDKE